MEQGRMDANPRKLPPAPPLPIEADVGPQEQFAELNECDRYMDETARMIRETPKRARVHCIRLYNWVRRGGPEVTAMSINTPDRSQAGWKLPPPLEQAVGRAARKCGKAKTTFYRWVEYGRIWVILGESQYRNSCDIEAKTASAYVLGPLIRLLPKITGPNAGIDNSQHIRPAFAEAVELAIAKDKKLSITHVRTVVDDRIGAIEKTWLDLEKALTAARNLAGRIGQPNAVLLSITKAIQEIEQ